MEGGVRGTGGEWRRVCLVGGMRAWKEEVDPTFPFI